MPESMASARKFFCVATILVVAIAGYLRYEAVMRLPVDFDELVYLPASFHYAGMIQTGHWKDLINDREVMEHPPLNRLLFAVDLCIRHPQEPNWKTLDVGQPIPQQYESAFFGPRMISAIGGTMQVLLVAVMHPIAGLLMALDTYHIKYSAQVYLEGVPGLMAVLAAFLFDLAFPKDPEREIRRSLLYLSAAALGLAAAGKYLYGAVGFVLLFFVILRTRSAPKAAVFCITALAIFLLADPYLWPNPALRLWESLTFHWHYAHGDHVTSTGLPWFTPFTYFLSAKPTHWHRGLFVTGLADVLILPLSLLSISRARKERPVWLAWAGFGLIVLLLWPTKWPQYTLLIVPPLCVCAGLEIQQLIGMVSNKLRRSRGTEMSGS